MMPRRVISAITIAAITLAGCGGRGSSGFLPQAIDKAKKTGTLTITIKVPKETTTSSHARRPLYISPSTQSLTIAVDNAAPVSYNLTATSPGCTDNASGLICTIMLSLSTGSHAATFKTYDGVNGSGNVLSSNSNVPLTVNPGAANAFGLILNGDIARIALLLDNSTPPQGTTATIPLSVNAYDADNNLIIGPGSYDNGPITLTDSDSSGATTLSASSIADPSMNVTVSYNGAAVPGGSATFSASAGSVVTSSVQDAVLRPAAPFTIYVPNIYTNSVTAFPSTARGNTAPAIAFASSRPSGIAFSGGNTYVSEWVPNEPSDEIAVYNSGQTAAAAVILGSNTKLFKPQGMAADAGGNIYVANESNTITAYAPDASGNATPLIDLEGSNTGLNIPVDVAIDASGKLYVANQPSGAGSVTVYAPGASGNAAPLATIAGPDTGVDGPAGIAIAPSGNLVVANSFDNTITTYSPGSNGDAVPISTISGPDTRLARPQGIAFDTAGNLWVANLNTSTIEEYAAGASGDATPVAEIAGSNTGMNGPLFMALHTPSSTPPTLATWSAKAPMPKAVEAFAAASINDVVYATGGYDGNSTGDGTAYLQSYNPSTNAWSMLAPMPTQRDANGMVAVNGSLYTIGGYNVSGVLGSVERYDPALNAWTEKTPMPTPRSLLGVAVVNGFIYAVGGSNQRLDAGAVNTVEAYDPSTDTWQEKAPLPAASSSLSVASVNGIVYAAGGSNGSSFFNTLYAYDPLTNAWAAKAPMPTARSGAVAEVLSGILYVIGGYNGTYLNTVESYNPQTNTWTEDAPMPTARMNLAGAVTTRGIFTLGGTTGAIFNTNELFSP